MDEDSDDEFHDANVNIHEGGADQEEVEPLDDQELQPREEEEGEEEEVQADVEREVVFEDEENENEDNENEENENEEQNENEENDENVVLEQELELNSVDYDLTLPARHTYLDMAMQNVEGYSYWKDGARVKLTIVPIPVLVVPGQTLPLRILDQDTMSLIIRNILDNNCVTFGAINLVSEMPYYRTRMLQDRTWSGRGVTVQILEVSEISETQLAMKCIGRQRFKTLSTRLRSRIDLQADVKIIEDAVPSRICDILGSPKDLVTLGAWPPWVYRNHDCEYIVKKIRTDLERGSPHIKLDDAPSDPALFSYWLVRTMPFGFEERIKLLREDNVLIRLKSQLELLIKIHEYHYHFCCGECFSLTTVTPISRCNQLFSMSEEGPSASYVNPHGALHETLTLYSVKHAVSTGTPTAQDSWFPGYVWSFIWCCKCRAHLGWKFKSANNNLQPEVFYGVRRTSVRIHSVT